MRRLPKLRGIDSPDSIHNHSTPLIGWGRKDRCKVDNTYFKAGKVLPVLVLISFFMACSGNQFTSGEAGAGAGGDATAEAGTGGTDSGSGGMAGQTSSGGLSGSGGDPPDGGGDTGADGGADTGDPCLVIATPTWVVDQLGASCNPIFGAASCNVATELERASLLSSLMLGYLPDTQRLGYSNPETASFADVPTTHGDFSAAEQALWLSIIEPEGNLFFPEDPASVCWAEPMLSALRNLPTVYAVAKANPPDNLPPDWFWATSVIYTVYGTSPALHFTESLRVVNNLDGDFSLGQDEDAIAEMRLECHDPDGLGDTPYTGVPVSGSVEFSNIDCFDQSGDGFELRVQFRVASLANGANTGDQIRMTIDPANLAPRGGGLDRVPTYTIE